MKAVKVPYDRLSPEALQGVLKEFVTRDGTDYGEREVSLETKVAQVLGQLKSGRVVNCIQLELVFKETASTLPRYSDTIHILLIIPNIPSHILSELILPH